MPIIEINNKKSSAVGKLAFWFDTEKPRRAPKAEKQKAFKRINDHRALHREPALKKSDIHSYEHLSADRSVGDGEQLFACTDQNQHTKIELQKIEIFSTLFKMGKIGFDYITKKFFIACDNLEQDIKAWQEKGSPLNFDVRS